ncbi:esterase [Leuconostoc pseudomesenteroides]|uniref:alpha/beta hydrolase n=1 Tax=Leuconostoc pseudomesenteroides TaxID=33968 RepID=UPI001E5831F1|nr:alpha/beta hydrolase [Leuconostoc pseudomesenteroides]MCC7669183.1 esterase [Leuconostoc pseudomesenteroides]
MLFKDKIYQYVPAKVPDNVTIFRDVDYASGARHQLDIYRPKTQHTVGVIVDIYGGGLLRGEKSSYKLQPSLRFLADHYAVVSPNYSLNTVHTNHFPNQIAEIRAVLSFLVAHAETYGLNMTDVVLIGESSGAQLAVLTAASISGGVMLGEKPAGAAFGELPQISHVIGLYGPYQVDQFVPQFKKLGISPKFSETGSKLSFEGIMLNNQRPADVPELVAQANPATYFSQKMPSLYLLAGTADDVVPYLQSVKLAQEYGDIVGQSAKTTWVSGAHHGPSDFDTDNIYQQKLAFIRQ